MPGMHTQESSGLLYLLSDQNLLPVSALTKLALPSSGCSSTELAAPAASITPAQQAGAEVTVMWGTESF